MWLRTMELDRPVPAEARSRVPLFASDDVSVPLTHTTSLDATGLKYLEPSCSAGGRDCSGVPMISAEHCE